MLKRNPLRNFPVKRKKPIVVNLGNVGLGFFGEVSAQRTANFASRFKGFRFFGIDLRKFHPTKKNWVQLKTDMVLGLKKLENNSVSLISSEMAIGYYGKRRIIKTQIGSERESMDYALKVLKIARKKLKPRGKFLIIIDSKRAKSLILKAIDAGFSIDKIKQSKYEPFENESFWSRFYKQDSEKIRMVRLTLEK